MVLIEAILPLSTILMSFIDLPLIATAIKPSSNDITSAATKAAYSPSECPDTASGFNPNSSNNLYRAISTVKSAG